MSRLGWAGGLSGFSSGLRSGYDFMEMLNERDRMRQGEEAVGNVIRDMFGPKPPTPMPGADTGMPQQAPMRSPAPTAYTPSALPGTTPMPQQAPMRGSMPTQRAPNFEVMSQAPDSGQPALTWQNVLQSVAKQFPPGTNPRVMVPVVDRLLPLMNSNSQMEWRELQGKLGGERVAQSGERVEQGWRKVEQGDQRIAQRDKQLAESRRMHDARISRINQQVNTAAAAAKLPPETKAMLDMHTKIFTQAGTSLRVAQTNLQRAQYEGSEDNVKAAQQDYEEAQASYDAALKSMSDYTKSIMPKAKIDFQDTAPAAAPAQSAPRAGATQTLPTGEVVTTTKTGAKAQIGTAPAPGGPVAKQTGEAGEIARKPPPAVKSATPGKTYPDAPRIPSQRKANTTYMTPKGPLTWTGTGWIKPRAAATGTK